MDAGKVNAIIKWINSLTTTECIESLSQLKDGQQVMAIANLIEDIPIQANIEGRWHNIFNFLEGRYRCRMDASIDIKPIIANGDDFEIAKVCLLLLPAAFLCEDNTMFVERAMRMETSLQHELREMVEWVVQPHQTLADLDISCFHQVLCKPLDPEQLYPNPQANSTPQAAGHRSCTGSAAPCMNMHKILSENVGATPVFSTSMQAGGSILGRFTSPGHSSMMTPMSPVQQMLQSPRMANRIQLQQKRRIKALERHLRSNRHLMAQYESEIEELRTEVCMKDKALSDQVQRLQAVTLKANELRFQVDEARQEIVETQSSAIKKSMNSNAELEEVRQRSGQLEKEKTSLYTQLHSMQEQISQLENDLHKVTRRHKAFEKIIINSEEDFELQLHEKDDLIKRLDQALQNIILENSQRSMEFNQLAKEIKLQQEMPGPVFEDGESLSAVAELQLKGKLEQLQNECAELIISRDQMAQELVKLTEGHKESIIKHENEVSLLKGNTWKTELEEKENDIHNLEAPPPPDVPATPSLRRSTRGKPFKETTVCSKSSPVHTRVQTW